MTSRSYEVGGQKFNDNSTDALAIKHVTMWRGGIKNCSKLRDVVYERPHTCFSDIH